MGKTVIFDIDGTLTNADHRLHYIIPPEGYKKDWDSFLSACKDDAPIENTIDVLMNLYGSGFRIVLLTGREERYRGVTVQWMDRYQVPYDELHMRPQGDRRHDWVIKEEWFKTRDDDFLCVFEDRSQVVDMWRNNGLTCYQVCRGDY